MFSVHEGAHAAALLRLGDDVQSKRGLAGRFGTIDFNDPAARKTADAQRNVEAKRTRRHCLDLDNFMIFAQTHDGAFTEGPFDLGEGGVKRLGLVH